MKLLWKVMKSKWFSFAMALLFVLFSLNTIFPIQTARAEDANPQEQSAGAQEIQAPPEITPAATPEEPAPTGSEPAVSPDAPAGDDSAPLANSAPEPSASAPASEPAVSPDAPAGDDSAPAANSVPAPTSDTPAPSDSAPAPSDPAPAPSDPALAPASDDDGGPVTNTAGTSISGSATLAVNKTKTWNWEITKTAWFNNWELLKGDKALSYYTIFVHKKSPTISGTGLTASVHVNNTGDIATTGLSITFTLKKKAGSDWTVIGGPFTLTPSAQIPKKSDANYSHTFDFDADMDAEYKVEAAVTITNHSGPGSVTTKGFTETCGVNSTDKVKEVNGTVHVTDSWDGVTTYDDPTDKTWECTGDRLIPYDRTFTAAESGDIVNTATIVETKQTASATVNIDRKDLVVTKKVCNVTFDRKYNWAITKTADKSEVKLYKGQTLPVNYTIGVTNTPVDSNVTVSGTIKVYNPSDTRCAVISGVSDVLSDGTHAVVTPPLGGFPYLLAPKMTLELLYTAKPADTTATGNTATVTKKNYLYYPTIPVTFCDVPGTTDFTGSADVHFGNPTNVKDDIATITDRFGTETPKTLGTVDAKNEASHTFPDSHDIGPYDAPGTYNMINTAKLTTDDTGTVKEAACTVKAVLPTPTLTLSKAFKDKDFKSTQPFTIQVTDPSGTKTPYEVSQGNSKTINLTSYGIYKIDEINVPEEFGFVSLSDGTTTTDPANPTLTLDVNGAVEAYAVTATNEPQGRLVVKKFSLNDPKLALKDMVFTVFDADMKPLLVDQKTDDKGVFYSGYMKPGTVLYVQETTAPPDYQLDTEAKKKVVLAAGDNEVVFKNALTDHGQIRIVKWDKDTNTKLAGAVFEIANNSEFKDDPAVAGDYFRVTMTDGEYTTDLIPSGRYYVREYAPPADYLKDDSVKTADVTLHGLATVEFYNTQAGLVKVTKKDKTSGELLSGMTFDIRKGSADGEAFKSGIKITDPKGTVIKDVPAGTYYVVETGAPEGYWNDSTPAKVVIEKGKTAEAVLQDTKNTYILWKKDNANQALNLSGAQFDIFNSSNALVGHYTTDADGKIVLSGFAAGKYTGVETVAPTGYVLNTTPFPFEIVSGQTGDIIVLNTPQEQEYITGNLKILKVDADSGKALKGAVFSVYADSALTDLVESGVETDADGVALVEGLDAGTYYIVETKAPSGYKKILGSITATVKAEDTVTLKVLNTKTEEQDYQTGTDDYNWLIGGGVVLLLGLAAILWSRRRVKE
jgi:LPXTG-motif cell wall-anchored protein